MSFKSRERKRRKRVKMQTDQRESRRSGSSANKWWLTLTKTATCCARCGGVLRPGREMVYRRTPLEALCVKCAEADPSVTWKPSTAWEETRSRRRRTGTRAKRQLKAEHRDTHGSGNSANESGDGDRPAPASAIFGPLDADGDWR